MKKAGPLIPMIAVALCFCMVSCQKSDVPGAPNGPTSDGKGQDPAQASEVVRLSKYSCLDPGVNNTEAFSLLIPAGWLFAGGVQWVLDNPAMPAVIRFTVKNPSGHEQLEVFPSQALFWTNNQMLLASFPVGSRYLGSEVMPVLGPQDALRSVVIPRFRSRVAGLEVTALTPMPELARALHAGAPQPGVQTFGDAARARIAYTLDGAPMEEDIFAVVEGYSFSFQALQGVVTNTNWYVDYIFSFRAPKGRLAENAALFRVMTDSFRISPQWFNAYNQVVDIMVRNQMQAIRSWGELSRYISQTNAEISDSMMQSYNERQKVYDRIGEKMSESIRGTERYVNPLEGSEVELPGGYRHVWTNPLGEYILTDSPSYNPSQEHSGSWQELQRKP
jgi:hypothetical protein